MDLIAGVFIYYIVFIIAGFFFIKADLASNDKRVKVCILLGVLVLSLFASIRGLTVGWDTYDTVNTNFIKLKYYNSFGSLWSNRDKIKEPVYWLISFIIRLVTDDSRVFLFVMQLLTVGPIAIVAYENRKKCSISIMMAVYMLLFYQVSLNIIRQSISAAFLLLAFSKLLKKSYAKASVYAVVACIMHNSGIIGLLLLITIYILIGNTNSSLRKFTLIVSVLLGIAFLFFWKSIFNYLINANILKGNYDNYVSIMSGEEYSKYTVFSSRNIIFEILRFLGLFIIIFALRGNHYGSNREVRILKYSIVVSFIIYSIINLVLKSYLADRMTLYLDYMQLLLCAFYAPKRLNDDTIRSSGVIAIPKTRVQYFLGYCLIINIIVYMYYNYGHTLPYILA